jgi:ferrous-iron efflux pump FieF
MTEEKQKNQNLLKQSTYVTIVGVSLIVLAKIYGWAITDSVSMLASLVDSLLDTCVSIMNLVALHYALIPADKEHRFGHGKAEDLAVFMQSIFFVSSGIFLIYESGLRLIFPKLDVMENSIEGIGVLIFSILITSIIVAFQYYVMRRAKSHVIAADSLHYLTDFLTNLAAIIGIAVTAYWSIPIFDSITAIAISIYIIFNAVKMFRKAFDNLMDHEFKDDEKNLIIEAVNSHKDVKGFHDLKTRYSGTKPFIQLHVELDEDVSLKSAHHIVSDVEGLILKKMPDAEIIIHADPEGVEEKIYYKD